MSIEIIDPRLFTALANKMDHAAHHKLEDIHSIPVCKRLTRVEIEGAVNVWSCLNIEAYNMDVEEEFQKTGTDVPMQFDRMPLSPYHFLKACRYVHENIPVRQFDSVRRLHNYEANALNLLRHLTNQTMERIIDSLPQYQNIQLNF